MFLKKLMKATGFILMLLIAQTAFAQNRVITGKVTDSKDGSGVAGATVSVKGTRIATQTKSDGTFSISVPSGTTTLVISSVGFASQDVSIEGKSSADVSLVVTNTTLNEVVVTGYGTVKRKDLTGAIATVSSKDFVKGPIISPEQLINGKVAGVQITAPSGAPGAGGRILIRGGASLQSGGGGTNNPLIIIDGVPVDQQGGIAGSPNALGLLNPNDIESFNILKDPSAAAIYGSRGSNGVIIITTKKGKSGKLRINFSTLNSISIVGKTVDVLSADEFRTIVNGKGSGTQKTLLGTSNTKWQDQIYGSAFATDNNISLTGGIEKLPYRLSIGFLNQDGILKTGSLRRNSFGLNVNPSLLKNHLKVDLNLRESISHSRFANEGAIGAAVSFDPTQSVQNSDGRFGGYWEWIDPSTNKPNVLGPKNPVGLLELRQDESNVNRFTGNIQLDYKFHFLPDLRANLNLGMDYSKGQGTIKIPDSSAQSYRRSITNGGGAEASGANNQYKQTKKNKLLELYLNYVKEIKKLSSRVDLMAGYGYQDFTTESPAYPDVAANGTVVTQAGNPFKTQNTLISFYGRLNYSLMNKYLVTVNWRADGSSRFAKDVRWGYFPSVAFAWSVSNEGFFKKQKVMSDLKFRLSYGQTGQQEIGRDYQYLPVYNLSNNTAMYQFGNAYFNVYRPQAYVANLKWETTTNYGAGVDFGFMKGRITGAIDIYKKVSTDLLSLVPLPVGTNFSNAAIDNVGSMENKGIEFNFNLGLIRQKNTTWDFGFNVTCNKNEITKLTKVNSPNFVGNLTGGISGGVGNTIQINSVGYPASSFYVLQQVYANGDIPVEAMYVDRNGDGIINNNDYYRYQSPNPDVILGVTSAYTCHNWSFNFTVRGNFGNYMYNNVNANSVFKSSSALFLNNLTRNYLETGFTNNQYFSDYYLQNASFLRMDQASLGYDFGKVFQDKANLRAIFNVQNVFVMTKYTGLDPEIASGIDNNFYPRPRIFSLGFNLDF
jgi:TonB-linked SusC/RagA family outer membrane protein